MILRRIVTYFLKPVAKWYLRRERKFSYKGTEVIVPQGVFHPGLFSSTKYLLEFLSDKKIEGQSLLELGSGAGLISIVSAKAGAIVTAVDLSPKAVYATSYNAERNQVSISIVRSDLFNQIPAQTFDWIVINPPFYPRRPTNDEELAWYCGEHHAYFHRLFKSISAYMTPKTVTVMVLSEDCDLVAITSIANSSGFKLEMASEKCIFLFERNFIFVIGRIG